DVAQQVLDAVIQVDGLTVFHADRNAALCVEFVTVRCRPFYLPWEFTTVFIVGVYILPSANAKEALCKLYRAISDLQNAHPNGLFIIAPSRCTHTHYRPAALTPIIMKCFERLVMREIKDLLPPSLDPMQFAYRPNRSTEDSISTTLHLSLTHLENKDTYVRMLFINFSSAFNTIIPQHLTSTTTLNTGAPQGCVLSPLLFTLLTHDCAAMHSSNHIIKFADDTTVVGLISKNDESAFREQVQRLTAWCKANNLSLNVEKMKEMVVDFRRAQSDHSPLDIDGSNVEIVKSTKFLGVHLVEDLTWSLNTSSIIKKAQQRLYFLQRLRKAHLPPPILTTFYRGTIESILSSYITA
ncbi:hypothetical protein QTP70_033888, partial [Hemibagrus guttatus]